MLGGREVQVREDQKGCTSWLLNYFEKIWMLQETPGSPDWIYERDGLE